MCEEPLHQRNYLAACFDCAVVTVAIKAQHSSQLVGSRFSCLVQIHSFLLKCNIISTNVAVVLCAFCKTNRLICKGKKYSNTSEQPERTECFCSFNTLKSVADIS